MNVTIPGQGRVISFYGPNKQSLIQCEELAELIQAISKMRRVRSSQQDGSQIDADDAYGNLVEEMSDVLICLEQMQEMYGIPDHQIQKAVMEKCARQEERIRGHV